MKRLKNIIKSIAALSGFLLMQFSSFAQQTVSETKKPDVIQISDALFDPVTYIWMLLGFILILTIYTMSKAVSVLTKVLEAKYLPLSNVPEVKIIEPAKEGPSLYSRIMHGLVKSVPIEKEKDFMLDHNYDGIQELDNQLPPWWKYGFYLTIVFAIVYLFNFHVSGSGKLQLAEYNEEMKNADLEKKERMVNNANYITSESVVKLFDANSIASGKEIYLKNCKACHGDFAQGNVGPNLTDEYWVHGGGIKYIFNTISDGVPSKGMISWKAQLTPKAIQEVSSYILTLQGTNPVAPKEPQGDKWVDVTENKIQADLIVADSVQAMALSNK